MMRGTPIGSSSSIRSLDMVSPTIVVFLVLLLGATIYLWRARYVRRKTAYVIMAFLGVILIAVGISMYTPHT